MSLVLIVAVASLICACFNGMGSTEVARARRERRVLLRHLEISRMEFVNAGTRDLVP